jgi:hypothetical protein
VNEQEAKARRAELVPQLRAYGQLERVLWPIVTASAEANFASDELNTDSRGHRVTRTAGRPHAATMPRPTRRS